MLRSQAEGLQLFALALCSSSAATEACSLVCAAT